MNHIHYMSDNLTICQKPNRLGYDFVVLQTKSEEDSCRVCSDLLFAHNLREYEREHRPSVIIHSAESEEGEPLSPSRGVILGMFLASWFWLALWIVGYINGWWS